MNVHCVTAARLDSA